MKISKHFDARELVPPQIWKTYGIISRQFLRPELLRVLDLLRDKLGRPVVVNNWHTGGQYKESGYRTPYTKTGAKYSQHKLGTAADVKVPEYTKDEVTYEAMTPMQVLAVILANADEFRAAGMTTYENPNATPTWLHIDCRWREPNNAFVMVNP